MSKKRKPRKNGRSKMSADLPPAIDERVCLYGDIQPCDDDPTRGTCTDCGAEFKLRDGVQPADYGTTDDSRDEQRPGDPGPDIDEERPGAASGDVQ